MSAAEPAAFIARIKEVLDGVTRDVPARVAVEQVVAALSERANVIGCVYFDFAARCLALTTSSATFSDELQKLASRVLHWQRESRPQAQVEPWSDKFLCAWPSLDRSGRPQGWLIALTSAALPCLDTLGPLSASLIGTALEHERQQARISSLDQRYLTVIESLPHVIYEQQLNGEMIYMSPKLRALTGYRVEEVLRGEVPFESIIHPEDRERWRRNLLRYWPDERDILSLDVLARSASARPIEYRLIHRDGREIIWVADHSVVRMRNPNETVSAPLRNDDLLVVGTLVDLRQRKRLEIEALQRSRLATIGELAASVAHEINNPLTAVLTYGQLLDRWFKRQVFPDTEARKGQEYLRHIIEQGRAIDTITRNLTGFVRKTSEEDLQPVNVAELIRTALAIFRYPLKRERIALDIKIDPNLPPIRARAGQLRQVLLNLVANARSSLNIRYPDDEAHVDKRIEIHAQLNEENQSYVRLAIRDWGEGIPPELKEKVFDAFFSTRKDGTGLGLSIVTSILEQHEAMIELESTLGEGTTFRIDLPIWTSLTRESGLRSPLDELIGHGEDD